MKKRLFILLFILILISGCAKSYGIDGKYTQNESVLTISEVDTQVMGGVDVNTVLTIEKDKIQISTPSVSGGQIIYSGKLTSSEKKDNGTKISISWDKRPDAIEQAGKLYDMDFECINSDIYVPDSDSENKTLFITLRYNLKTNGKTIDSFLTYVFID